MALVIHLPGHPAPGSPTGHRAADWITNFIEEAATFPNGRHDDQIDAYCQAINWARTNSYGPTTIHAAKGGSPTPTTATTPASAPTAGTAEIATSRHERPTSNA